MSITPIAIMEALFSRVVIIDKGKIVLDDTPTALLAMSSAHQTVYVAVPDFQRDRVSALFEEMQQVSVIDDHPDSKGTHLYALKPETAESVVADLLEVVIADSQFPHAITRTCMPFNI